MYIKKSQRFKCGSISVEIMGDNNREYDNLKQHITQRLSHNLMFQKYKKETINREAVSLKTYLSRKGFLQTGLSLEEYKNKKTHTVDLKWNITVHQKRSFMFYGNQFFSQKELLEKMIAFGRSAWLMPASLLAEEILNAYKRKGFWKAEVVGKEEKERSTFVVQEGPRTRIKAIDVHNAHYMDASFIKRRCFRKMLRNTYYDAHLCEEAIKKLSHIYVNAGFLSFRIIEHTFVPLEEENEYALIIIIDEGKQGYIASITVEGYEELEKIWPFQQNFIDDKILFDSKIIDQQREWLTHYFQKEGYTHPRIK